MKKAIISLIITLTALQFQTYAQSKSEEKEVVDFACYWFESLIETKSVSQLMDISEVPFALDKASVVNTYIELWALYQEIFSHKGERKIPSYSAHLSHYYNEIFEQNIPLSHYIVTINIEEGDHSGDAITVTVLNKDNKLKIVGFRD